MADETQDRDALERSVLCYLTEHPAAADTIDGVRLWWLRDAGAINPTALRIVLDELLKRGWLVARGSRLETQIYSLNERERETVTQFVRRRGNRLDG